MERQQKKKTKTCHSAVGECFKDLVKDKERLVRLKMHSRSKMLSKQNAMAALSGGKVFNGRSKTTANGNFTGIQNYLLTASEKQFKH